MKRCFAAILLAFSLLLSACSAAPVPGSSSPPAPADSSFAPAPDGAAQPVHNPQVEQLHIWNSRRIPAGFAGMADGFGSQHTVGGGYLFTLGYRNDGSWQLLRTGLDGTGAAALPSPVLQPDTPTSESRPEAIAAAPDGALWLLETVLHYEEPDNHGIIAMDCRLHRLAADGTPLAVYPLEVPLEAGLYNGCHMAATADGTCYLTLKEELLAVTADGSCRSIPVAWAAGGSISTLAAAADGSALVLRCYDGSWVYSNLLYFPDTAVFLPIDSPDQPPYYRLTAGADGAVYRWDSEALYALDRESRRWHTVLDFLNSDVNGFYDVDRLWPQPDGSFLAVADNESYTDLQITVLTPADPTAVPVKELVTLGCAYLSTDLHRQVVAFNRQSSTVRVLITDYAENPNGFAPAYALADAEAAGRSPDLLVYGSELPFDEMAADGRLIDLYPLLDGDGTLSRADFWPTALAATELDGRLTSIMPVFSVSTLAAAPDAAGEAPGWTWQQLAAMLAAHPEARAFPSMDRAGFVWNALICLEGRFVNAAARSCDFDDPEFISLLEFAATLPQYSSLEDTRGLLASRKALLLDVTLSTYDRMRYLQDDFGSAVTLKGYPTADGSAGSSFLSWHRIGITAASPQPQAAWQFVRYLLSAESQRSWPYGTFVLRQDVSEEQMAAALLPPPLRKGDREGAAYMRPTTGAEVQQTVQLIGDTRLLYRNSDGLQTAVRDALAPFFAGEVTAAQAAAATQQAVTAYLAGQ